MLEVIKTANLPEEAQVSQDMRGRAEYFLRVLYMGRPYFIPLTHKMKKAFGISISKGYAHCKLGFELAEAFRDIINTVYLQVRDTVGSEIHDQISRQVSDGFKKMLDVHLARAIDAKFEEKLPAKTPFAIAGVRAAMRPSDWDRCPHCNGSFSFNKLGENFICPWCEKDVRTSNRTA
jgi:hypothetical protein